jgi:hypothetical protein
MGTVGIGINQAVINPALSNPNGPHYHIFGTGHYYPGMIVPEPYATSYFSFR